MQEAYKDLKEEIIPDIENDIRYTIAKTTNGKYAKVYYNDQNGLVTENEWGEMVPVYKLSIGTMDQMYLGFRMAIADKYNEAPFFIDEAFAFCDDARLKNILRTLSEIAQTRQIILFSCSQREKQLLESMQVEYNLIEM